MLEDPTSAKAIVDMLADLVTHGIHGALLYNRKGDLVYIPVVWENKRKELEVLEDDPEDFT